MPVTLVGTAHEKAGAISFVLNEWRTEDVGEALNLEKASRCAPAIIARASCGGSATRPPFVRPSRSTTLQRTSMPRRGSASPRDARQRGFEPQNRAGEKSRRTPQESGKHIVVGGGASRRPAHLPSVARRRQHPRHADRATDRRRQARPTSRRRNPGTSERARHQYERVRRRSTAFPPMARQER